MTADAPSGDALDRANQLLARRYVSVTQNPALLEDVARLIDAADAAGDMRAEAGDAHQEKIDRRAAQGIIDGCTDRGRGVDGRSYWQLVERVAKLLAEKRGLQDELRKNPDQGDDEVATLQRRINDLEQAQEVRAHAIRGAQMQHRRLEERALTAEAERDERDGQVRHWQRIAEERAAGLRDTQDRLDRLSRFAIKDASTEALVDEIRRRLYKKESE